MHFELPYGRGTLPADIPDARVAAVLRGRLESYVPEADPETLMQRAMEHPIGSEPLEKLAEGKHNIVVIISDHTRPVPSKLLHRTPPLAQRTV